MSAIYDVETYETDSCAMATLQTRWLEEYFSPAIFFERLCTLDPSAPECREYDV